MSTMTKSTIISYADQDQFLNSALPEFDSMMRAKIAEMFAAGKTDNIKRFASGNNATADNHLPNVLRDWRDLAAAQEWVAFVQSTAASHNVELTSVLILEYVNDPADVNSLTLHEMQSLPLA